MRGDALASKGRTGSASALPVGAQPTAIPQADEAPISAQQPPAQQADTPQPETSRPQTGQEEAGPRGPRSPRSSRSQVGATQEHLTTSLADLDAQIGHLTNLDFEDVGVHACEVAFAELEQASRRLKALQTLVYQSIQRRRVDFVEYKRPDDPRAGQKAKRKLSEDLQQRTRQTPSEVNHIDRTAQQLDSASSPTRDAFLRGDITTRHMQLLGETIRDIDDENATDLERELLEVATRVDTRDFAKECQRRLAEMNYPKAVDDQKARHDRRAMRMSMGDDGMLRISGQLAGIDAETAATALQHFRQPDPAGTPAAGCRTPEQATADAFAQMCDLALRHADSTEHGHRPQVIVTIDYQTLLAEAGIANAAHLGPLTFDEIRRLLSDAGVARILTDPKGIPVEAGQGKRSVPNGLWRSLIVRDGGCVADGCTAPAGWCDVAHLDIPHRKDGRLTLDNAAMACRRHHRNFDLGNWTWTQVDGRPVIHHPDRPPSRSVRATRHRTRAPSDDGRSSRPPATSRPPGTSQSPGKDPRSRPSQPDDGAFDRRISDPPGTSPPGTEQRGSPQPGPDQRDPDQRGTDHRGPDQRGPDQRGRNRADLTDGDDQRGTHERGQNRAGPVDGSDLPDLSADSSQASLFSEQG